MNNDINISIVQTNNNLIQKFNLSIFISLYINRLQ